MSNPSNPNTCPKCGAAIPAGAPQGLCPKCVLAGAATATESGVAATATGEIPSLERVAAAFPQLEVLELIGRGGMGFVFKARQPSLDRLVALKLLPDKLARDPNFTERFNREGRVLGRLNHANIVSIYDFGQTGGFYFLLMEYVDGVNLRQAMRAGRFSPSEALAIVPKVCEALQYAHEQGVLHRDIKPENILLDAKGRVKIADFGIAKLVDDSPLEVTLTGTGASLGTPHYMAPEQLEKPSTVDHRADIYSLGVVFYEMLTGELPIGRFAAPSSKTPVGTNVDEVVFRTLEKEPGNRYQSAGEVQTRVQDLADEANAAERRGPAGPVAGAPLGPHGTVVLGDAAPVKRPAQGLLVVGILGWVGSLVVMLFLAYAGLGEQFPISPAELGVIASLMILFNSTIILAALKMMKLQAYPLAVVGSLLAMITPPGNIIGLPIGIWALLTLRQPKVRAVFKAESARASLPPYSRWSIYGAILVGLSLPAPLRIIVSLLTREPGVTSAELWFALSSVAMPGLGGTLLGWLALNEIRENAGRVRGLPLAMFATLMWPLTLLGAVVVGVPMFLLVPAGEPTASHMVGRFLVLLLPAAVIAFAFWAVYATARWAGQPGPARQSGLVKWVFICILVAGMGVVMLTQPKRRSPEPALPTSQVVGNTSEMKLKDPAQVAQTKVVEFSLFKNQSAIFLTTLSPLGPDEALVPILERPDGRREIGQIVTHFSRENNRVQEQATAVWNWAIAGGAPEEAMRIERLLEENFTGRPLTLVAGQPLYLFSFTNRAGGALRGYLDYRPDFAQNAYRATESGQAGEAYVRVERGVISGGSSSTLILFLKPSVPAGHSLQPVADGSMGTAGQSERTISQSLGNATFTCNWRFPESFTSNDVFTAQAQCEKLRQSPPLTIPSGGQQLLFAVTNQFGEVHRGFLELVKQAGPYENVR